MNKLILLLAAVCIFASCKKRNSNDDTNPDDNSAVSYSNYLPLRTGSYWIYQNFDLDTNGAYTSTGVIDSDYVAGDTLVNGITYGKWYRNNAVLGASTYIVRDSLHYIVDITGARIFSSQNFTDTFDMQYGFNATDTLYFSYFKMEDNNAGVSVPAGTFITNNAKTTYILYPPFSNGLANPRYINLRFAQNVGLVYETLMPFASSPTYKVRKLIRYHIEPV